MQRIKKSIDAIKKSLSPNKSPAKSSESDSEIVILQLIESSLKQLSTDLHNYGIDKKSSVETIFKNFNSLGAKINAPKKAKNHSNKNESIDNIKKVITSIVDTYVIKLDIIKSCQDNPKYEKTAVINLIDNLKKQFECVASYKDNNKLTLNILDKKVINVVNRINELLESLCDNALVHNNPIKIITKLAIEKVSEEHLGKTEDQSNTDFKGDDHDKILDKNLFELANSQFIEDPVKDSQITFNENHDKSNADLIKAHSPQNENLDHKNLSEQTVELKLHSFLSESKVKNHSEQEVQRSNRFKTDVLGQKNDELQSLDISQVPQSFTLKDEQENTPKTTKARIGGIGLDKAFKEEIKTDQFDIYKNSRTVIEVEESRNFHNSLSKDLNNGRSKLGIFSPVQGQGPNEILDTSLDQARSPKGIDGFNSSIKDFKSGVLSSEKDLLMTSKITDDLLKNSPRVIEDKPLENLNSSVSKDLNTSRSKNDIFSPFQEPVLNAILDQSINNQVRSRAEIERRDSSFKNLESEVLNHDKESVQKIQEEQSRNDNLRKTSSIFNGFNKKPIENESTEGTQNQARSKSPMDRLSNLFRSSKSAITDKHKALVPNDESKMGEISIDDIKGQMVSKALDTSDINKTPPRSKSPFQKFANFINPSKRTDDSNDTSLALKEKESKAIEKLAVGYLEKLLEITDKYKLLDCSEEELSSIFEYLIKGTGDNEREKESLKDFQKLLFSIKSLEMKHLDVSSKPYQIIDDKAIRDLIKQLDAKASSDSLGDVLLKISLNNKEVNKILEQINHNVGSHKNNLKKRLIEFDIILKQELVKTVRAQGEKLKQAKNNALKVKIFEVKSRKHSEVNYNELLQRDKQNIKKIFSSKKSKELLENKTYLKSLIESQKANELLDDVTSIPSQEVSIKEKSRNLKQAKKEIKGLDRTGLSSQQYLKMKQKVKEVQEAIKKQNEAKPQTFYSQLVKKGGDLLSKSKVLAENAMTSAQSFAERAGLNSKSKEISPEELYLKEALELQKTLSRELAKFNNINLVSLIGAKEKEVNLKNTIEGILNDYTRGIDVIKEKVKQSNINLPKGNVVGTGILNIPFKIGSMFTSNSNVLKPNIDTALDALNGGQVFYREFQQFVEQLIEELEGNIKTIEAKLSNEKDATLAEAKVLLGKLENIDEASKPIIYNAIEENVKKFTKIKSELNLDENPVIKSLQEAYDTYQSDCLIKEAQSKIELAILKLKVEDRLKDFEMDLKTELTKLINSAKKSLDGLDINVNELVEIFQDMKTKYESELSLFNQEYLKSYKSLGKVESKEIEEVKHVKAELEKLTEQFFHHISVKNIVSEIKLEWNQILQDSKAKYEEIKAQFNDIDKSSPKSLDNLTKIREMFAKHKEESDGKLLLLSRSLSKNLNDAQQKIEKPSTYTQSFVDSMTCKKRADFNIGKLLDKSDLVKIENEIKNSISGLSSEIKNKFKKELNSKQIVSKSLLDLEKTLQEKIKVLQDTSSIKNKKCDEINKLLKNTKEDVTKKRDTLENALAKVKSDHSSEFVESITTNINHEIESKYKTLLSDCEDIFQKKGSAYNLLIKEKTIFKNVTNQVKAALLKLTSDEVKAINSSISKLKINLKEVEKSLEKVKSKIDCFELPNAEEISQASKLKETVNSFKEDTKSAKLTELLKDIKFQPIGSYMINIFGSFSQGSLEDWMSSELSSTLKLIEHIDTEEVGYITQMKNFGNKMLSAGIAVSSDAIGMGLEYVKTPMLSVSNHIKQLGSMTSDGLSALITQIYSKIKSSPANKGNDSNTKDGELQDSAPIEPKPIYQGKDSGNINGNKISIVRKELIPINDQDKDLTDKTLITQTNGVDTIGSVNPVENSLKPNEVKSQPLLATPQLFSSYVYSPSIDYSNSYNASFAGQGGDYFDSTME